MKAFKLSLVYALTNDDKVIRRTFCESMLEMVEDDKILFLRIVFSDEATFHLSGKVNRHNVHTKGPHIPHKAVEHQGDAHKINVYCVVPQDKAYSPFLFEKNTVTGQIYLEMLQN